MGAEPRRHSRQKVGSLLDRAVERARAAGFASVTVAGEPSGHRWRVLDQLAADRGRPLVCVQPLLVWRSLEAEDLTWDKSGPKDATLIARLAAVCRCCEPERVAATSARLRHLGARRAALTTDARSSVQQLRDCSSASGRLRSTPRGARSGPSGRT